MTTLTLNKPTPTRYLVCPDAVAAGRKAARYMHAGRRLHLWLVRHSWQRGSDPKVTRRIYLVEDKMANVYNWAAAYHHTTMERLTYHPCGSALCPVHADARDTSMAVPS